MSDAIYYRSLVIGRTPFFCSFDLGPIHWVGISTEYYGYYYEYGMDPVMTQYEWLKNDLKVRNPKR